VSRSIREVTNRLARECIYKLDNVLLGNIVSPEDTGANTNTVLSGWSPVELLHTSITNERGIQGGEIISGDYDGDSGILLFVVHSWELDIGWVVSNVHEGCIHHLVVYSVLGGAPHSSCPCIEIIYEEAAHLPLSDDICCLTVSLPDQLCGLSCIPTFEFPRAHHDRTGKSSDVSITVTG